MKKIKSVCRHIAFALAACLLLSLIPADVFAAPGRKLTLMIYICGSNLETESRSATADIREMLEAHNDPESASVLIMIGGAKEWHDGFPSDRSVIYELVDGEPVEVWSHDLMNMGEPDTLTTLLDFGYANYPAEDYALIMWDHGGGPLYGVCFDEAHKKYGSMDPLTTEELETALSGSPCADEPLEWIGFDACLMATAEVANICAPYAKYMIASQEVEGAWGWNYAFLENIGSDPGGAVTGIRIVDSYFANKRCERYSYSTLSLTDLRRIGDLSAALDTMFYLLDDVLDEDTFSAISNVRRDTSSVARASSDAEYDLIDLYDMAALYAEYYPEEAEELMDAIDGVIIYHRSNAEGLNGLSIYYPYYSKDIYTGTAKYTYDDLVISEGYSVFLKDYTDIWLGGSLSSWSGMKTAPMTSQPIFEDGVPLFNMELTDEQLHNFAYAHLYVMSCDESLGLYSFAYITDDVVLSGNTLSAAYNNTSMYVLDKNGNPLSSALEYGVVEDVYTLRAILCGGDSLLDGETLPVSIRLKRVPGTDELEVFDVTDLSGDGIVIGKQSVSLDSDKWKNIYIAKYPVYMTQDENGDVLPFPDWEDSDWVFADIISNEEEWTVSFVEESYVTDNFAAMFVVTDTQGNRYGSDLVRIENKNVQAVSVEPCTLADNGDITAKLVGAGYSTADYDPGLILRIEITNNTDLTARIYAKDFIIGGVAMDRSKAIADNVAPGATVTASLVLSTEQLAESGICSMPDMRFTLSMYDAEAFDIIAEHEVSIGQAIDLAPIMENESMPAVPVTAPAAGAISAELYGATLNENGSVSAWLRYTNNTQTDVDTYVSDVIINGCMISGVMSHSLWLPAGTTACTQVTIEPAVAPDALYYTDLPQLTEPFAYWGISEINSLSLIVCDEENEYHCVNAYVAAPISIYSGEMTVHADENLYSGETFGIIRRGSISCDGSYLNVTLIIENRTDEPVEIDILDAGVDSEERYASTTADGDMNFLSTVSLPANTVTRCMLGFDITGADTDAGIGELSFTAECGGETADITITLPAGTTLGTLTAQ